MSYCTKFDFRYTNRILTFFIFIIIGILSSILIKNQNLYDLANYHYYNAFSFLNDRQDLDIVPSMVNTFYNPIIDIPFYLLVKHFNDTPNVIYVYLGIWSGLFLFALYKICFLFFNYDKTGLLKTSLVFLLAITGRATSSQLGSYTNEITVSFFILWGLYILLKMIKFPETQTLKKFFYPA